MSRSRSLLTAGGALLLLTAGPAARAASPTPDRPQRAASGHLVGRGTIEAELGGLWAGGVQAPARLKFSPGGSLEARVSADLAGIAAGQPGLGGELKLALADGSSGALALYAVSAVPLGGEAWSGTLQLLADAELSGSTVLTLNAGAGFGGGNDGPVFTHIPVVVALSSGLFGSVSGYAEGAAKVVPGGEQVIGQWLLDAGLGWTVTEIVVVDAAAGWDFGTSQPFFAAGVTVNLGHPGK